MGAIYQLWMLEEVVREYGKPDRIKKFLAGEPDLDSALDAILEAYPNDTFTLLNGLSKSFNRANFWPWAMVAFPKEMPLGGFVSAFRESREQVVFTCYQLMPDYNPHRDGVMPVGVVCFRTPQALREMAIPDIYFRDAWQALEEKQDGGHWMYINDPIPPDELERAERENQRLYLDSLGR